LSGERFDPVPSHYIGFDENDAYRGIAYLRIDGKVDVVVTTGMRAQFFPGVESEIVHQILIQELYEALIRVPSGKNQATPLGEIDWQVRGSMRTNSSSYQPADTVEAPAKSKHRRLAQCLIEIPPCSARPPFVKGACLSPLCQRGVRGDLSL
jgi:hypothetical protein